jgi:hypothetical protein
MVQFSTQVLWYTIDYADVLSFTFQIQWSFYHTGFLPLCGKQYVQPFIWWWWWIIVLIRLYALSHLLFWPVCVCECKCVWVCVSVYVNVCVSVCVSVCVWYWCLNSGLHACWAGTVHLEPNASSPNSGCLMLISKWLGTVYSKYLSWDLSSSYFSCLLIHLKVELNLLNWESSVWEHQFLGQEDFGPDYRTDIYSSFT